MTFTAALASLHALPIFIIVGGVVLFIALLILLIWIRMERRAIHNRYRNPLPTWSDAYRDALAHRVKKPSRVVPKEEADR